MVFLICLNFISIANAEKISCEKIEITYKLSNQINKINADVCTNSYGQYYSKNCTEGCEFKEALGNNKNIKISTDGMGSPGARVCSQLGYRSYRVEFIFKGKSVKNLSLCFSESKESFVSAAFLADLVE